MTKNNKLSRLAISTDKVSCALREWRRWLPLGLAVGTPQILRAENQVDYRYEYYNEDNNRMKIETHSVYFNQQLSKSVSAKGEFIYDGISGGNPTGTHNLAGKMLTTQVEDERFAGNIALDWQLSNHLLTPGVAYSQEHDYVSDGISLNDAITFNDKNTTIQFGASHNFDRVRHADRLTWSDKDSTDVIIGISQLLTPKTVLSGAFTYGYDDGYLNDPYRLAEYHPNIFPAGFNIGVPEHRPGYRSREIAFVSLTQYFEKLHASVEGSYRLHHDSYDVTSHTATLTWHQWLGDHLIVEPMIRYYQQSAASFYTQTFSGPFSSDPSGLHSSDYRLSELYSVDYGAQATVIVTDHVRVSAGYHRYLMHGMDHTDENMYPKAHIFTVGFTILW